MEERRGGVSCLLAEEERKEGRKIELLLLLQLTK
jgi:hypothetical protein